MTASQTDATEEYLAAGIQALSTDAGDDALDSLGFWDLLAHLDDIDARRAIFALFRAHGRTLAGSSALGGLMAQPYLHSSGLTAGAVVATVPRRTTQGSIAHLVLGVLGDRQLVVDRPGQGAVLVPANAVVLGQVLLPGMPALYEPAIDWSAAQTIIAEADMGPVRQRSVFLGRVAAAAEMLGAAEAAVSFAHEYASQREQFGQPIGKFQAVRHLLAWASTDCVAIESVVAKAVALDTGSPASYDEVVKALAGRNGRKACERALQVLGGIGFTTEHDHHRYHSRILALDAVLGTSAELTHNLGARLRRQGTDPGFPSAILLHRTNA